MRNLIKFYVEPYKSTHKKRAINVVLGLGCIFKNIPQSNILEKNFEGQLGIIKVKRIEI